MFKTNQVVIRPPKIIRNWKEIIDQKVKIFYTNASDNIEKYIESSPEEINYYQKNKKLLLLPTNPSLFEITNQAIVEIVKNNAILLSPRIVTPAFHQVLCSFSKEDQLFKLIPFRDESSYEFVTGFIFSRNYTDPKGNINLISTFEKGLTQIDRKKFFIGFDLLATSAKHAYEQTILCENDLNRNLHRSNIYFGHLKLFQEFFKLCTLNIFIAIFVLVFECLV